MTTWSSASKDDSTWTQVLKHEYGVSFGDGFFGYGLFGGGDSWTSEDKASTTWTAADAETTTWVQVAQSGKVEAMFEYNEPLGGPEWSAVDKDE